MCVASVPQGGPPGLVRWEVPCEHRLTCWYTGKAGRGAATGRVTGGPGDRRRGHTGVNFPRSYPQIFRPFPLLWKRLWITPGTGSGLRPEAIRYFHCVEKPNPAAMKPKPTAMFQLPKASTGRSPPVT